MSTTRIYLKNAKPSDFEMRETAAGIKYPYLYGFKVEDPERNPYVHIGDPMDPAFRLPNIPRGYRGRCTHQSSYAEGFRSEGFYRTKTAKARVETVRERTMQMIVISATSPKAIRAIYTEIRLGKLQPTENWGQDVGAASTGTSTAE